MINAEQSPHVTDTLGHLIDRIFENGFDLSAEVKEQLNEDFTFEILWMFKHAMGDKDFIAAVNKWATEQGLQD